MIIRLVNAEVCDKLQPVSVFHLSEGMTTNKEVQVTGTHLNQICILFCRP